MSGTRSRLRENGGKKLTQISKLFPKQSTGDEDDDEVQDVERRPVRKRSAEVGQAGPSSSKQTKPTLKALTKSKKESKPTANVISKFFLPNEDDENDDNDDFASPKKRTAPVRTTILKSKKPKKVSAKTAKQINMIKEKYFSNVVQEHSARDGVDPDQLQLALAISRSLLPDELAVDAEPEDSTQVIRTKKQKAVHEIFQRFGFKSGLEEYDPNDFLVNQTKRKARRKWDTKCTSLTRRDPIAQKRKCDARISKMTSRFVVPDQSISARPFTEVTSPFLSSFHIAERLFFDAHGEADQRSLRDFYTNNLCEISAIPAGVLLKDWSQIPGRDVSPKRLERTLTAKSDELFLSAESNVDGNEEGEFFSAKSNLAVEEIGLNISDEVVNLTDSKTQLKLLNKSNSWSAPDDSLNEGENNVSLSKRSRSMDLRFSTDSETEENAEMEINCSQKHFRLNRSPSTSSHPTKSQDPPSIHKRAFTRSPSPDMFADDSVDQDELLSGSDNPPCSLDPISSSGSSTGLHRVMTEEDCVIELYATGAILLNESKRTSTALTTVEKDQSTDTLTMPLNYSGLSEKSMPTRTTTPTIEVDGDPVETGNDLDLHVSIQDQEAYRFDDVDELMASNNAEISRTGVVFFESFVDNVKICDADRSHADKSIAECIEISDDDESSNENDESKTPHKSITPPDNTCKIVKPDTSLLYDSPTDEVNFSFESVQSDLETTLNSAKKSLSRKLFEKTLQNPQTVHDPIDTGCDAHNESLSFSFPSEENHINGIASETTTIVNELSNKETVNKETLLDPIPNEDSIEISDDDDEFEYSIRLSKNNVNKSPSNKPLLNDDSIEISDDEINYSMSHESSITQPRRRKYPFLRSPNEDALNESLQQIFDDNLDPAALDDLHLQLNHQPTEDLDLVNQSVQSIVRKDFVSNTKPRTSSSGTSLRRTTSAMLANVSTSKQPTKFLSRLDETMAKDFSMDYDSFDDLLQGLNLPDSARQTALQSPVKDEQHKFTVIHDGSTFEVKIGARCVSPKPNFETMDSPTIARQLNKYGLKPLVRRKAIICLEHIYNRMHPFVECPDEESPISRSHFDGNALPQVDELSEAHSPDHPDPITNPACDSLKLYTTRNPTSKTLPADFFVYFMNVQSEYYLPSPPRAKKPWCLQPLHTAWFNLLLDNPRLFEQILQYEPLELRLIRSTFKEIGLLFDNNDLIAFLDKHCITFRTESTPRNKMRSPKKVCRPPLAGN